MLSAFFRLRAASHAAVSTAATRVPVSKAIASRYATRVSHRFNSWDKPYAVDAPDGDHDLQDLERSMCVCSVDWKLFSPFLIHPLFSFHLCHNTSYIIGRILCLGQTNHWCRIHYGGCRRNYWNARRRFGQTIVCRGCSGRRARFGGCGKMLRLQFRLFETKPALISSLNKSSSYSATRDQSFFPFLYMPPHRNHMYATNTYTTVGRRSTWKELIESSIKHRYWKILRKWKKSSIVVRKWTRRVTTPMLRFTIPNIERVKYGLWCSNTTWICCVLSTLGWLLYDWTGFCNLSWKLFMRCSRLV